ncbi:MAG: sigma-70 family RNA polymerase sigma factor [Herpetosiphon sp.]
MQLPPDSTLCSLVRAAQQFDEQAFDELYGLFADAIYKYFVYRCNDQETAEDLTSSVFLRVVEALPRFQLPEKGESAAFTGWIFRIASNQLQDYYRRTKRQFEPLHEQIASPLVVGEAVDLEAEYQEVRTALSFLTDDQQHVLFLRFSEELSIEAVATITGQNVSGVKSMQHRALRRLATVLERILRPQQD